MFCTIIFRNTWRSSSFFTGFSYKYQHFTGLRINKLQSNRMRLFSFMQRTGIKFSFSDIFTNVVFEFFFAGLYNTEFSFQHSPIK